jgi:hypothetical protein
MTSELSPLLRRLWPTIKVTWFALCATVLAITTFEPSAPDNRDNGIALVLLMLGLSFPSGYLVSIAYFALAMLSRKKEFPPVSNVYLGFFLTWLGFVIAGYIQWFVVLPAVVHKIRHRFGRSSMKSPAPPSSS